jgi:hypothetical protein
VREELTNKNFATGRRAGAGSRVVSYVVSTFHCQGPRCPFCTLARCQHLFLLSEHTYLSFVAHWNPQATLCFGPGVHLPPSSSGSAAGPLSVGLTASPVPWRGRSCSAGSASALRVGATLVPGKVLEIFSMVLWHCCLTACQTGLSAHTGFAGLSRTAPWVCLPRVLGSTRAHRSTECHWLD